GAQSVRRRLSYWPRAASPAPMLAAALSHVRLCDRLATWSGLNVTSLPRASPRLCPAARIPPTAVAARMDQVAVVRAFGAPQRSRKWVARRAAVPDSSSRRQSSASASGDAWGGPESAGDRRRAELRRRADPARWSALASLKR